MAFPQCFCHETCTAGVLAARSCAVSVCILKVLQVRIALETRGGWGLDSIPKLGQSPGFSTLKMGVETHCHGESCELETSLDLYLDEVGFSKNCG